MLPREQSEKVTAMMGVLEMRKENKNSPKTTYRMP